jgi:hypothetical protein
MTKSFDYYLQGAMLHRAMTHKSNRQARKMFREALREDPSFARAYAFLSYAQLIAYLQDWIDPRHGADADINIREIRANADRAQSLDNGDYETLWSWAAANIYSRDYAIGMPLYEEALRRASRDAIPENMSTLEVERADALMFHGEDRHVNRAIEIVEREIADAARSGRAYRKTHLWTLGWANYEMAYYDPQRADIYAKNSLDALLQFRVPDALILKNIVASYVLLGSINAARQAAKEVLPLLPPGYTVAFEAKWPYFHNGDDRLRRWQGHLVDAGLPPA